jgi:low affinity Fe/Cu permease
MKLGRQTWADRTERFSTFISQWAGSSTALISSLIVVIAWAVAGPLFKYSDSWQLIINTVTNVATFVMVFLIQRAQNKDALAVQIKLSELLAAARGSEDPVVAIEELSESELRRMHARYLELVRRGDRPPPVALESPPSSNTNP